MKQITLLFTQASFCLQHSGVCGNGKVQSQRLKEGQKPMSEAQMAKRGGVCGDVSLPIS